MRTITTHLHDTIAEAPADLQAIYNYLEPHARDSWLMLDIDGDTVDLPLY